MEQGGKGRRTRRRGEVKVVRATVASSMREWLQATLARAQKRKALGQRRRPSGSGVTLEMVAISRGAERREPEFVVEHSGPNRAERRRWGARVSDPVNRPYVNPERDLKPGRRLRGA